MAKYILSPFARLVDKLGEEEARNEMRRRGAQRKHNKGGGFNSKETVQKAIEARGAKKDDGIWEEKEEFTQEG